MGLKYVKRISFLVFFIVSITAIAQERPPTQIFTPKDYLSEPQNWSITQSHEKYIYVANNKGLLEFNGVNWKLYKSPNSTILRSVELVDDVIYTGCNNDFGYWKRDELGLLYYTSLSDALQIKFLDDEEFWNIINIDDYILFQSLDRIYVYNKSKKSYEVIDSDSSINKIFKVNNVIYFQKDKEGLYKIENGSSKAVSIAPIFKTQIIVNVFDYKKALLIETEGAGFFILSDAGLVRWEAPINDIISRYNVYRSIRLKDNSFVLGTTSNGVLILSPDGHLKSHIDRIHGLSGNTIHNLFEDTEGNVWLALNNGINCINFNSPFSIYNDEYGKLGTVNTSAVFKNNLYLGTNQGLFFKPLNSKDEFEFIKGTQGAVWCLTEIGEQLFCGHNSGTYSISNDKATKIVDVSGTWNIKPISKDLLLQGNYDGLYVIEQIDNKWELRNKLEGFNISSRFFEIDQDNQILVSHEYQGLFNLKISADYTRVLNVEKLSITNQNIELYSSLLKYHDRVLFSSKSGIYVKERLNTKFIKDSLLSTLFTKEDYTTGKLVFTKESNTLWSFSKNNLNYITPSNLSTGKKIERLPFSKEMDLGLTGYENITYLKDKQYIMGTSSGYITIDLNKTYVNNYSIKINTIKKYAIGKPSELINKNEEGFFKNRHNNIEFSFSVPEFQKYLDTKYQYQLEGLYTEWSDLLSSSSVTFENLPYGDYVFKVKAKLGNSYTNNIETYHFSIDKPWYLQKYMIAIYVLFIVLFSLFMHNIYKRYYKKQREALLKKTNRELELKELENKQQLMRFNNEKLRQDIENKNKELNVSTMSLVEKNEFLNNLKKELLNIKDIKNINKVIKIIDRNINNDDDWKVFEEVFNNADKDFLKKIKTLHPSLTSNDLRLCTYLRLNLSSKEIAPLLNISPKSVEVKRYRLRKKLDLTHEASLSDYILEI